MNSLPPKINSKRTLNLNDPEQLRNERLFIQCELDDNYDNQPFLLFQQCVLNFSLNPLPDDKILDWSKLKQIADDIAFKMEN